MEERMRNSDFIFHYVDKAYYGSHGISYNFHQIASNRNEFYVESPYWIKKKSLEPRNDEEFLKYMITSVLYHKEMPHYLQRVNSFLILIFYLLLKRS